LKSAHVKARLVALNMRDSPDLGKVEYAPLDDVGEHRTAVDLRCERIYFAADQGICLRREVHILTAQTVATILDVNFQPRFTLRTNGIPSRARISPDGRYAAFTVFLTGHSYGDAQLSTATLLVDMQQGTTFANLEEFQVLQDGNVIKSPDFNYWGVTFQRDSNFFYATLRTKGVNYLVRGDIQARTITVIYKGVECPSLSPDGKRVAFKKLISRNNWRLTVLDLATLQETPLAEIKSVDDQAEWLDNHRVLYAVVDGAPWMSVMVVPADGSGQPQVFAKGATSPAVTR
jgi:Tol biopolymer transport system component